VNEDFSGPAIAPGFAETTARTKRAGMENRRPVCIRAYDDGVDRWEMVAAEPAPALRGRVDSYSQYWEETRSFAARRELAGTSGVLIYALGEPLEIIGADGRNLVVKAGEAFTGGIADATSVSRGRGQQAGIHVFLPLQSLAAAVGAPLAALANCVAPLRDLIGERADALGGRLCEASSSEERFRLLDDFLASRFVPAPSWKGRSIMRCAAWPAPRRRRRGPSPTRSAGPRGISPGASGPRSASPRTGSAALRGSSVSPLHSFALRTTALPALPPNMAMSTRRI
jgi:hypothetical protein